MVRIQKCIPIEIATVGSRCRYARQCAGLSVKQSAQLLGMSATCLSKMENGGWNPRRYRLETLASLYAVSLSWLAKGDNANLAPYMVAIEELDPDRQDRLMLLLDMIVLDRS